MGRYEDSLKVLREGKVLLEKHFGAQHPLMNDFSDAEKLVQMQVAPAEIDPYADDEAAAMGHIDSSNIGTLLDKRSELMKRGRVKRVYYQET